ncbi:flagellar biosynthetic protein FliO [Prosthecomicrobium pneumaticum]|uniref:Flagellar biosynthesis protein FliO n=1 Tax=Prosthecomicrobium pneumaticum TaxID=81895 RepID=A0A7W9FQL2_9HYPH|nr:flagellar biosynthetic protein FliO [Prosthecomicrobium pneumaticum]MBB5755068.1 hypothetical protein [Prosthecomicrobium pneumaticum]
MREFLQPMFGDTGALIVQFVVTLAIVLVLILIAVWLIRSFSAGRLGGAGRGRQPRLSVVDALSIDGRRRLVLVRRDQTEHLILIGGPSDLVVEPGIHRVPRPRPDQTARPETGRIEPARAEPPRPAAAPTPRAPEPPRAAEPPRAPETRRPPVVAAAEIEPPPATSMPPVAPVLPEFAIEAETSGIDEPSRRRPVARPILSDEPEVEAPAAAEPQPVPAPPAPPADEEEDDRPLRGRLVPPFLLNRRARDAAAQPAPPQPPPQAEPRAAERGPRPPRPAAAEPAPLPELPVAVPVRPYRPERVVAQPAPSRAPIEPPPVVAPPVVAAPPAEEPAPQAEPARRRAPLATPTVAPPQPQPQPRPKPPEGRLSRLEPVFDDDELDDEHGLSDIPGGAIEEEPVFGARRAEPRPAAPPVQAPAPREPETVAPQPEDEPEAAPPPGEKPASPIGDLEREMARLLGEISNSRPR